MTDDLKKLIDDMSPEEKLLVLSYFSSDREEFLFAAGEARARFERADGYRAGKPDDLRNRYAQTLNGVLVGYIRRDSLRAAVVHDLAADLAAVRDTELERVSGYADRLEGMVIERDREATQWAERLHEAEAAISRVREVHDVHSCERDGHIHRSTPNPCVNDGVCSCGRRDPCPTLEALDSPKDATDD